MRLNLFEDLDYEAIDFLVVG